MTKFNAKQFVKYLENTGFEVVQEGAICEMWRATVDTENGLFELRVVEGMVQANKPNGTVKYWDDLTDARARQYVRQVLEFNAPVAEAEPEVGEAPEADVEPEVERAPRPVTKTIASEDGILTLEVERADWSIRFYSFETRRHATRRVWHPTSGSADIYVQYAGRFWNVCTEMDGGYHPWLVFDLVEVAAEEPEAPMTVYSEALDERTEISPTDLTLDVWDDEGTETVSLRAWRGDNGRLYVTVRGQVRSVTEYMGALYLGGPWRKVVAATEGPRFAELTPGQLDYVENAGIGPVAVTPEQMARISDELGLRNIAEEGDLRSVRNAVVRHLSALADGARESGRDGDAYRYVNNMSGICTVIDLRLTGYNG